jgi:hypothetical protein
VPAYSPRRGRHVSQQSLQLLLRLGKRIIALSLSLRFTGE